MSSRPFLDPRIKMTVEFPDAEQLITPSNEDTLGAEVSRNVRRRDAMPQGGIITTSLKGNEIIFDLNDNISSMRELNIIHEEIINAFHSIINYDVDPSDVVVKADIMTVFPIGLD